MGDLVSVEKEIAFAFDNFECYTDDDQLRLVVALPKCINMQKAEFGITTPVLFGLLHFFVKRSLCTDNHSGMAGIFQNNNLIISDLVRQDPFRKNMVKTLTSKREYIIMAFLDSQRRPSASVHRLPIQDQVFLIVNGKTADFLLQPMIQTYLDDAAKYNEQHQTNKWASRSCMDHSAQNLKSISARYPDSNSLAVFRAFYKAGDMQNVESMAKLVPGVKKFLLMK